MPPKSSSKQKQHGPTQQELEAINNYLSQKPDFDKLLEEAKQNPQPALPRHETDYDRQLSEAVAESLAEHRQASQSQKPT